MSQQATYLLIPYLMLGLLIASSFLLRSRIVLSLLLGAQILIAFLFNLMEPVALFSVAAFWGICALHWRNLSSQETINALRTLFIALIGILFARHMVPGFYNLRLFSGITLSPHSAPYTMYLNFDKTIVAVIIAMISGIFVKQKVPFGMRALGQTGLTVLICTFLLIPLGLLSGLVQYEPKFSSTFWLWAFNNIYFVCFAEEILFRGLIQNQLIQLSRRWHLSPYFSIVLSAILFAVLLPGHLQGGPLFVSFVALTGMFYGYAYYKTQRLEAAILVHFLVNLIHYLFFTYPLVLR